MPHLDPVLKAALGYAADGFPVVPVIYDKKSDKKFPPMKGWQKLGTTDPGVIRDWWGPGGPHEGRGVAVLTGLRSRLYSVDVDVRNNGFQSWKKLKLQGLDRVPTTVTQSGGNHFHFRTRPGEILKNTMSLIGPGIDTRGEGGCIVMPPTRFDPNRPPYAWVNGVKLIDAPPLPIEILELLRRDKAHVALSAAAESLRTSPSGKRHECILQATLEMAKLIRKGKLTHDEVLDALTDAAKEVGHDRLEVEAALDGAMQLARGTKYSKAPPPPPDPVKLAASAAAIIASNDVLSQFADAVAISIAGEVTNAKILYLVCTARLFAKTMHAVVKGPSSGGKSEVRKCVLGFFPPEEVISFTSLSERALIYFPTDFEHKILSMGEATGEEDQRLQDMLLRELMSEGVLRYPVAQKVGTEIVTTIIEKHGPVCFLLTTTRANLFAENETRVLSLETDDSPEQTRKVLAKIAEVVGDNNAAGIDLTAWRDFQRWLGTGNHAVVVPYAVVLADMIPPRAVRLRRDFGQLLGAIKAQALIHRAHRKVDAGGRIVADIGHDYAVVRELLSDIIDVGSETKIRATTLATLEAVKALQPAAARDPYGTDQGAKVRDIAHRLGLDRSAATRRLRTAEAAGFIVNLVSEAGGKRRPSLWRTTSDAILAASLLPEPKALEWRYSGSTGAGT